MKIGEIDYNLKAPKRSLFLCKPNKTIIAKINEAYDTQYDTKLGTVNELSFKIPTTIIKDDIPMDNPNIERIKNRYLFKYVIGSVTEYFLFNEANKSYGDDEYIEYRAYSLGSQLSDKNIREFEMVGNLKQVVDGVLDDVYGSLTDVPIKRWSVGYVDSYFTSSDSSYRKYTVSSMSLLEVIYDIASNWDSVIKWDTENLTISFYKAENVGLNKGFYIRDGKYLENFNLQIDTSSTITRLRAFGSEGLTFREISEIGEDFIQDFTFYMYPFEYDSENEKVIRSSDYMSDELCIALTKYNTLIESMSETYSTISAKIVTLQETLAQEEIELTNIVRERVLIEDERDVLLAEYQPKKEYWGTNGFNEYGTKENTEEHKEILERLKIKKAQESTQKTAVENAEMYLKDALEEKEEHLEKLSASKNFTTEEWSELQQFIIEKEYTNESITDVNDLLKEAKVAFKQNQEPAIKLSVSIIDFLSVVECQNDWNKLNLGDTIRIRYDRLKVDIQAKIIEINYDFENFGITLTIANEKDLRDGSDKLMDLLSKADMTSTIVSLEKDKWNLSKENNGKINDIINNKWDSLKNAVVAGYEQMISISERGIIVKSLDDPLSWLVIQNGFLAITNDGGNSWKHAISKDGIWGEYIFGKVISGVNLNIEDESGIWKTQGSRTTIYNRDGKEVMWLGLISDNARDQFDNILEGKEECFGLKSWNEANMIEISECKGISISRWKDDDWEKVFWANDSGTLYSRDMVAEQLKIVNNIGDTILDAETNFLDIGKFQNIVADGKLTTLEKLQIAKELHAIHADYKALLAHAEKYNLSARDNVTDIDGAFDTATQSFSTTTSTKSKVNTKPIIDAYTELITYISNYIPIIEKGIAVDKAFEIDQNNELMEKTSDIADRGYFIQVFRDYYDESNLLKQAIEDSIFYSGIHMGEYYNNLMMNEFGFVAVRSDGKYRAFLNATNGLALQKWETDHWVNKLYGSIGDPNWEDGTLVAEGLVAKKLRIWDGEMDKITFDWYNGISILGDKANIYLNANDSIKITDKNGDKKFGVDTNGHLFAKDITTHNLKIVNGQMGEKIILDQDTGITINGNNGEKITLNGNVGIDIKINNESVFGINNSGVLYARKLQIMNGIFNEDVLQYLDENDSYISDLAVTKLRTLDINDPYNYVSIKERNLSFITRFENSDGTYTDRAKYQMYFKEEGEEAYPVAVWGTGSGDRTTDNNKAQQYKTSSGFFTEYVDEYGEKHEINLTTDRTKSIELKSPRTISIAGGQGSITMNNSLLELKFGNNKITLSSTGVSINGTRVDIN